MFKIGKVKIKGNVVLSPMSGVTDVAFRALSRKYGADLTYTEFVNSTGLVHRKKNSLDIIKTDPIEKPVAIQLFGSSISDVIKAGEMVSSTFDIIDVNCGCPAWKVVKTGAGSAMLNDPEKIGRFVNKLVTALNKPITVKIRKGIGLKSNALEVAKIIEDNGASAIAIHGRSQKQGYTGEADWEIIKKVKEGVNIPVIGSGDVFTPESFSKRIEESGVDAIMIARGAIGNPFIFSQIKDYMKKGSYSQPDKFLMFREYLVLAKKHSIDFAPIKRHALYFTKGLKGSSKFRDSLNKVNSLELLEKELGKFEKSY